MKLSHCATLAHFFNIITNRLGAGTACCDWPHTARSHVRSLEDRLFLSDGVLHNPGHWYKDDKKIDIFKNNFPKLLQLKILMR